MRTIYLIRHAMPDIPFGERWCVGGQTDLPLNRLGRMQAALLPSMSELQGLNAVFCSPLSRARETALPLCPSPRVIEGLEEQRMGVWDGLSFTEIMARFPERYAAREADLSVLPEGAESLDAVALIGDRAGRAALLDTGDVPGLLNDPRKHYAILPWWSSWSTSKSSRMSSPKWETVGGASR